MDTDILLRSITLVLKSAGVGTVSLACLAATPVWKGTCPAKFAFRLSDFLSGEVSLIFFEWFTSTHSLCRFAPAEAAGNHDRYNRCFRSSVGNIVVGNIVV